MKALIMQSGTRGNLLFTTPLIRALKGELGAEVHVLAPGSTHAVLQDNPYLDKTEELNMHIRALRKKLKKEKYDLIIDLIGNFRSFRIRWQIAPRSLVFKNKPLAKWVFTTIKLNRLPKKHLVDQYLELLSPLGIKGDNLGLDFHIPEKDEVEIGWLPETHRRMYAAILIDADHETRKLPATRLIELCDRINKPIVLIGSEKEAAVGKIVSDFFHPGTPEEEEEIKVLNKKAIVFNACGLFNFHQQASLIRQAQWVFSYDNDLMQVAAALKKPVFTLWGNTTPYFGKYPYRTQFTVFENNKLKCRPCAVGGHAQCPKGHFKCMNDITFDFYLPDYEDALSH